MLRITSETELLETFRALDRDEVQTPHGVKYPLAVRDYLAWPEPSGHRIFLVFEDQATKQPRGVVFQRTPAPADTPASMCQWCHAVRSGSGVGLLTAAAGRNRRIGLHLCSDLNCRDHALGAPGIHDFNEGLSSTEKMQRLLQRMSDFVRGNLF
jgi:hypothetical protein